MAFGLQFDDVNDIVTFSTWTATGDFSISMEFTHTSGLDIFLGLGTVTTNFVASRNTTQVRTRIGGATQDTSGFVVGNTYTGTLSRTGSTVTLNLNGGAINDSWTNSNTFTLDRFGHTSFPYGGILSTTWTMTGSGNQRDYDFNQTSGNVVPELSDGQTGTLVNFPTDDSQWVDLGGGISVTVTETGPSFTEVINATLTASITASISENGPSFTETINTTLSVNITSNITEVGPSFTESISATITSTSAIIASISEQGPGFTETINASLDVNIAVAITELGPSFTESINVSLTTDITSIITETGPSFVESIIVQLPVTIIVNPRNVIRAKRQGNTITVKRKSNSVKIRSKSNIIRVR